MKDKLEAMSEVKAKEKEEKDMVAQQVILTYFFYVPQFLFWRCLFLQCKNELIYPNIMCFTQNMYAQLLPLALPAPPMPGMGGGMGGSFGGPPGLAPMPPMGGMGMPPMPPFGMPPMGTY